MELDHIDTDATQHPSSMPLDSQDIRSAAAWLCFANDANPEDASNNILSRIIAYKAGRLDADPQGKREAEQFVSV